MRMSFKIIDVIDCHKITGSDFIFLIQRALLLSLKEAGRLNEMQHRQTEATLLEQHREYIREQVESLKDD